MRFGTIGFLAMAAGASLSVVSAANAVTFADYGATDSFNNLQWTQSDNGLSGTLSAVGGVSDVAAVQFSFLTPSLASLANLPASFTITGNAPLIDPAIPAGGFLIQPNLSGSFHFTYTGAADLVVASHTYHTGANLLSGNFTGASISGPVNSTAGSVLDATSSGGDVTFTSDFLQFAPTGDKAFALELTSIADPLHANPGNSLDSFGAVSTGSFQSDLSITGGQGVPEAATWALMIVGFGGVGAMLRRRRHSVGSFSTAM